jgi:heme exporter protein D
MMVFTQSLKITQLVTTTLEVRNNVIRLIRRQPARKTRIRAHMLTTEIRTPQTLHS